MDYLIEIIAWILGIGAFICINILFVPIFVGLYRISRSTGSTDYAVELFTYPLDEPPANYIDVEFTVITE